MARWYDISANRRTLAYLLFSAVVLGFMLFLGILPTRREITETRQEGRRLKARIEAQKIFHPLYQRLQKNMEDEKEREHFDGRKTAHNRPALTIDTVSGILSAMAASAGLPEASFSPAPASMSQEADKLLVQGRLQGDYADFRNFLIRLVTAPDFQAIELMEIQSGARHPKYRLQMWVSVQ